MATVERRAQPAAKKSRKLSLTRAERAELVKRRLFDAAVKVVGQYGYAEATVARITKLAGVAQGTFYNHFPNRQDLLDQLLPTVGQQLLAFIRVKVHGIRDQAEIEEARFRAFFDFLIEMPQFMRILNEAQVFAPEGYEKHLDLVQKNYIRALRRGGVGNDLSDEELQVAVYIMMGARSYLSHNFSYTDKNVHLPVDAVYSAYNKLIRSGLFSNSVPRP